MDARPRVPADRRLHRVPADRPATAEAQEAAPPAHAQADPGGGRSTSRDRRRGTSPRAARTDRDQRGRAPSPARRGDRAVLRRSELLCRDRERDRRREAPRPRRVLHLGERPERAPSARPADRAREVWHRGPGHRRRHRLAWRRPAVLQATRRGGRGGVLVQPGIAVHAAPPPRGLSLASQDRRVRRPGRLHGRHEHGRYPDRRVHRRCRVARHPRAIHRLDRPCAPARVRRGLGVLRRQGPAVRAAVLPGTRRDRDRRRRPDRVVRAGPRRVRDPQDVLRRDHPGSPSRLADDAVLRPRRRDPVRDRVGRDARCRRPADRPCEGRLEARRPRRAQLLCRDPRGRRAPVRVHAAVRPREDDRDRRRRRDRRECEPR